MEKLNAAVFLAAAETGSFRKAADRLGYTQAGVSYIIGAMEEELGLTLFLREHGGVRLSPEGEAVLPQIRQMYQWDRQFQQTVRELKGLELGSIRVQIFDSISIHWIPGIIQQFQKDFPKIKIELISGENSENAENMIASGEVDCGFILKGTHKSLDTWPLMEDQLMACVAEDHPLADYSCFPLKDLGKYPFIGKQYDDHTGVREIFRRNHISPRVSFYVDNDYAAMAMVSKNLGYGIFPELLLKDIPYALRCLPFDTPQVRTISIACASSETCSGACRKFIEYTIRWVAEAGYSASLRQ